MRPLLLMAPSLADTRPLLLMVAMEVETVSGQFVTPLLLVVPPAPWSLVLIPSRHLTGSLLVKLELELTNPPFGSLFVPLFLDTVFLMLVPLSLTLLPSLVVTRKLSFFGLGGTTVLFAVTITGLVEEEEEGVTARVE